MGWDCPIDFTEAGAMKKFFVVFLVVVFCFLVDEYVSGLNRICFYDCADGLIAITIYAADVCPVSL